MPHDDDGVSLSLSPLDPSAIAITFFLRIFHARIANAPKNSAEIKTQGGAVASSVGVARACPPARGVFKISLNPISSIPSK